MLVETLLCAFVFAVASVLLCILAPGTLSLMFVLLMAAILVIGFYFGVARVASFDRAFLRASREIKRAKGVQAQEVWQVVRNNPDFFKFGLLDGPFDRYRDDVDEARNGGASILPDIEDYVNLETVELST